MNDAVDASLATGVPWSGSERNHVFFGGFPGTHFEDLSGISGLDDPADGRSFALLDFDRDGRQDVALAGPGAPRLRLLRNGIGERVGADNGFIALRFVGGNHAAVPSTGWSARDGFGTAITLDLGARRLFREHQPETGFVGQHSSTMLVGIGDSDTIPRLDVRWLSGKVQSKTDIPARQLVTIYENPVHSPTGEPFVIEPYLGPATSLAPHLEARDFWKTRLLPPVPRASELVLQREDRPLRAERGLTLVATMATWCVPCVEELPEFRALRDAFAPQELAIYTVPVDDGDTPSMLKAWQARHRPPYELLTGIERAEVDKVNAVTTDELRAYAVPATFLTDPTGRVLIARWGVPSISDVRRHLWQLEARQPDSPQLAYSASPARRSPSR